MQGLALLLFVLALPRDAAVGDGELTDALAFDEACSAGADGEGCDLSFRQLRGGLRVAASVVEEPEYNCLMKELWSPEKQAWCCENENLGCLEANTKNGTDSGKHRFKVRRIVIYKNAYCHKGHGGKELLSSFQNDRKTCRQECHAHKACRGFTFSTGFCQLLRHIHVKKCEVKDEYTTVLLPRRGGGKKQHKKHHGTQKVAKEFPALVAASVGEPEYNCLTKELWSPEKQTWCCENENLGCPEANSTNGTDSGKRRYKVRRIVIYKNAYCHAGSGGKELLPSFPEGRGACLRRCRAHKRCHGFTSSKGFCQLLKNIHIMKCEVNHGYRTVQLPRRRGKKHRDHHKKHPDAEQVAQE